MGGDIARGHRLKLTGPFGSAHLRSDVASRLVLVAGGTGFAPIWSIASAALQERPDRKLVIVVGVRATPDLYMPSALRWLGAHPNVTIIPVVETGSTGGRHISTGRPTDHLPPLSTKDVVHAAGPPPLVDAVARIAEAAGALCYADAFTTSVEDEDQRRPAWLRSVASFGQDAWRALVRARQHVNIA